MTNNPLNGYQPEYADAEAANEAATRQCDCPQAREYQAELERAEKREKNINKLRKALDDVSAYFTKERGVEYTDALYDLLFNCGVAVLDELAEKVNLNFGRVKVAISTNSKGAIVIALTYSDGARVEV